MSEEELARHYAEADLFLCLSDHEGFCVPLIEAMWAGLPIVAYASSAVPETAGEAALLLDEKPPSLVAEAVAEALRNSALADRMAAGSASSGCGRSRRKIGGPGRRVRGGHRMSPVAMGDRVPPALGRALSAVLTRLERWGALERRTG